MKELIFLALIGFLVGCGAVPEPTSLPEPMPILCLGLPLVDGVTCTQIDETNAILQSSGSDAVTMTQGDFDISIRGRLQLQRFDDKLVINALEGNIVVTVSGRTRVLRERQRLELPIADGVIQPSDSVAESIADDELTALAITLTPHPSETPVTQNTESTSEATVESSLTHQASAEPSITSEATIELNVTPEIPAETATVEDGATVTATRPIDDHNIDEDCEPRATWNLTYTVVAGNVLESIARNYGTTVQEMALANCLDNPGILAVGQVLRVPNDRPTLTHSTIVFQADNNTINNGDCTILRWDAANAQDVYFDDEQTTAINTRRVCPSTTTSYQLRVVYQDDSEVTRDRTIVVNP